MSTTASSGLSDSPTSSRHLLSVLPVVLFLLATLLKLSYFNFPPREALPNDWYPWEPGQALIAVVCSISALLILAAPTLLLPPFRRLVALWLIDFVASVVVLADIVHFRYYDDVISVLALGTAGQLGMAYQSVVDLLHPADVLFFSDVIAGAVLLAWYRRDLRVAGPAKRRVRTAAAALATGLMLAAIPVTIVANDRTNDQIFFNDHFRYFGVRRIGLLDAHLFEAWQVATSHLLAMHRATGADRARVSAFLEGERAGAAARSPLFGVARGRNVIQIQVESLHEFPIGLRIEGRDVTPVLNAFAQRSLTFDHFFDQTWEGGSADGEFTALHSLYPLAAGAVQTRFPGNYYHGLPWILREHGYSTLSASGFYGELWKMQEMHPRLGFEQSYFRESYHMTELVGMGIGDGEFFEQTLPRMAGLQQPFLAYLLTLSTHHPYDLPDKHSTLKLPLSLANSQLGLYLQTVHYFDTVLGEFLTALDRSGLLDRSVVVIYGDHSAHLGRDRKHRDPSSYTVAVGLREGIQGEHPTPNGFDFPAWRAENTIPLIIHLPHDEAAGVRTISGGHVDIAPTLLSLLGIVDDEATMLGHDLTRGPSSLVVFRDGGFIEGDTLCLASGGGLASAQCHNLATGESLAAAALRPRLEQARARLDISDLIVEGDLVTRHRAGD